MKPFFRALSLSAITLLGLQGCGESELSHWSSAHSNIGTLQLKAEVGQQPRITSSMTGSPQLKVSLKI
ncbi:hypothetical protein [Thiomicrorhabdus sp.]|uniref:hypothetical protein n=1 Tax=Thiomicrorhabdus sp. TaxID=2039724 RepID=UPI0029C62D34|nr:hypothetical protein [Thiomicrorhabdus sp.]